MKSKGTLLLVLGNIFALLFLGACSSSQADKEVVSTQTATKTITAQTTATPVSTTSPTNTPINTQAPITASSELVPRYILPGAPFSPVEILGSRCNYQGDIWAEKSAYIAYSCPDLNVTWLSARFTNLEEGEAALDLFGQTPNEVNRGVGNSRIGSEDVFGKLPSEDAISIPPADSLSEYDNIIITGRVENSEYAYFMVYETDTFVISSEVFLPEVAMSLDEYYPDNVEKVLHAVLEVMLENIKSGGSSLQPTPMAIDQQNLHDQFAPWLVTMSEANGFYKGASDMFGDPFDGTWVLLGDDVNVERESVCRIFEDRSNADAPLVAFYNCVYIRPDFDLDSLKENFPNSVVLESAFDYPDQSIIYGHQLNNGHTSLNAFVLQDGYLLYTFIESRTLMGKTAEDVFKGFNDGLIHSVMMTNLERHIEESTPTQAPDPASLFAGVWHRLSGNTPPANPSHQVNDCQEEEMWTCVFKNYPEPDRDFDYNPNVVGAFEGIYIPDWNCPRWFPDAICKNAIFVVGGTTVFKDGENDLQVDIEYIVVETGGEQKLYEYWVNRFSCPWYRSFDEALSKNPYPHRLNDCIYAP